MASCPLSGRVRYPRAHVLQREERVGVCIQRQHGGRQRTHSRVFLPAGLPAQLQPHAAGSDTQPRHTRVPRCLGIDFLCSLWEQTNDAHTASYVAVFCWRHKNNCDAFSQQWPPTAERYVTRQLSVSVSRLKRIPHMNPEGAVNRSCDDTISHSFLFFLHTLFFKMFRAALNRYSRVNGTLLETIFPCGLTYFCYCSWLLQQQQTAYEDRETTTLSAFLK